MADSIASRVTTPVRAANPPSRAAFGSGRPSCSSASSVAGQVSGRVASECVEKIAESEVVEGLRGVDEDETRRGEPGEEIDLVDQVVLNDEGVGSHDRLAPLRIGPVSIRQNETTGAPIRSEPKLGKACACRPSAKAATDSTSAAVTTP